MKKLLFIAAIASAALAACTKNDVVPSASEQQEITFANPVSHVVTKVDLVPITYPTGSSFSVFADYHKDPYATAKASASNFTAYMRGTEGVDVTHSTTVIGTTPNIYNSYWVSAKPYYWPKDGYLTVAAYSPADTKKDATIEYDVTKGVQITDYVVKSDLTNQRDLMLSNREVDETSAKMVIDNPDPYDGVQLTFNHVLSAIKFTVVTDIDYSTEANGQYTITLKSLKIKNAYSTGDLTQFKDINELTIDMETETTPESIWSDVDTENTDGYAISVPAPGTLSAEETTFSDSDDADLVLLPQLLDHTSASGGKVTAEVVYTVYHADMGDVSNAIEYTASLDLSQGSATATWDAGKRYIYNIKIGMDKVIFAPKVTAWDTQTEIKL